jgi:anthranilate phosphoribosyltransferase
MFAPLLSRARQRALPVFDASLGFTRRLNLLGPLSNPAGAPRQIVGVWRHEFAGKRWRACWRRSARNTRGVFTGKYGLGRDNTCRKDSTSRKRATVKLRLSRSRPEDFGFDVGRLSIILRGGDTEANAAIVAAVLAGERQGRGACAGDQ